MSGPVYRTTTRVLVVVHSHHSDYPINLSLDTRSLKSSKTTKSVGSMSLIVMPNRNYFNYVYPNDTINVYVDVGDGVSGFERLFMGYIDKVERTEVVDEKGAVTSAFRLVCSDFQKAFERTVVHVNQHIQHRRDLIEEEYLVSGSPTGLMTTGVRAHGSPADMVENLTNMLLGFGKQWVLPTSYDSTSKVVSDNRQRRAHRALSRIPSGALDNASKLIGGLLEATDQTMLAFETFSDLEEKINRANVGTGDNPSEIESLSTTAGSSITNNKVVRSGVLSSQAFGQIRRGIESLRSYFVSLKEVSSEVYTVLDLLDLSFIESSAVDGYIQDNSVWLNGGSLTSIMKKFSNELVNEMIFDLRPVSVPGKRNSLDTSKYLDRCFGDQYSTLPDELGFNHGYVDPTTGDTTFKSSVQAVAYVPSIVFREHPYSCTEGVDLGNLMATEGNPLGFIPFGPIFSQQSLDGKSRYRAIYDYGNVKEIQNKTLSVSALSCSFDGPPLKHLDVVTIDTTDVISSTIGRSDNDTTNFLTMFAEDGLGEIYKHIMKEFMPVTNPISIARNGLRVREDTSRFAEYNRDTLCDGGTGGKLTGNTFRNLVRWILLVDHWTQHNIEYLTGDITLRAMPWVRVGYRLDWNDRHESYYVDSVGHTWEYGKELVTSVQVSKGQRNDPFLSYIPPKSTTLTSSAKETVEGGDRGKDGRLADFFRVLNTPATSRSTQSNDPDIKSDNLIDKGPSLYSGNVVYCDGTRDTAEDILNLVKTKAKIPTEGLSTTNQETLESPIKKEILAAAAKKRPSRNYDDIFEKYGGRLGDTKYTVPFLRALSKNESNLNPLETKGPAWGLMQVGVDGFADSDYLPYSSEHPFHIRKDGTKVKSKSGEVLVSYNDKFNKSYLPPDVLDPDLNVNIATELLARIVAIHKKKGLAENWLSRDWVGILVAGWNAGYSQKAGTGRMIEWLKDNGQEQTLSNVHFKVTDARVDGVNITKLLTRERKWNWWHRVVNTYFEYLEDAK